MFYKDNFLEFISTNPTYDLQILDIGYKENRHKSTRALASFCMPSCLKTTHEND